MKKALLISAALLLLIFTSCGESECFSYTTFPPKNPYNETEYNDVRAVMEEFYQGGLSHRTGSYDEFLPHEDTSVTDIPLRVYGYYRFGRVWDMDTLWKYSMYGSPVMSLDDAAYDPSIFYTQRVIVCYDTSNHAIEETLKSIRGTDTVYIQGRLRYWTAYTLAEILGAGHCCHLFPGIWVDSAEDITLSPKDPQP